MISICSFILRLFEGVSLLDRVGWNPHLIDEHDGEDGLIDVPGGAVSGEDKLDNGRSERTFVSRVFKKGNGATPEVGQSLVEFNLREALDSLQDDIELSSLAGTNGNTSGLNEKKQERGFINLHIFITMFCSFNV